MDLETWRKIFEAAIVQFNSVTGLEIPPSIGGGAAFGLALTVAVLAAMMNGKKFRTAIRCLWSRKPVLDEDGEAVVATVRTELDGVERTIHEGSKQTIEHIKSGLEDLEREIRAATTAQVDPELKSLLRVLGARVEQSSELMKERADDETPQRIGDSPSLDRNGRLPRRQMVRLLRETILSNLWSGNFFTENRQQRFVFQTTFLDAQKDLISVIVRTPFAEPAANADEFEVKYPYEIAVRLSSQARTETVMRMYWDPVRPDDILVRYATRGDWEKAIMSWNVTQDFIPLVMDGENVVSMREGAR